MASRNLLDFRLRNYVWRPGISPDFTGIIQEASGLAPTCSYPRRHRIPHGEQHFSQSRDQIQKTVHANPRGIEDPKFQTEIPYQIQYFQTFVHSW
jgi:hypothetical protein